LSCDITVACTTCSMRLWWERFGGYTGFVAWWIYLCSSVIVVVKHQNAVSQFGCEEQLRPVRFGKLRPHLHLTTSKVKMIVWRLRGNVIRTVLYIANVLLLQWAQLTKTVHTARLGLEFVFLYFLGCMICLYVGVCFVLHWTVESYPFMLWRWCNKLKRAPFQFFLPPHYCGLGAGSIPLRAIVNKKQCETRGLFMSLVIHYWIGDVQDCQGVSASEMTYIVLSGALNSTYSLLGCFYFPKRKLQLLKARYSLTVLKVPLTVKTPIIVQRLSQKYGRIFHFVEKLWNLAHS